MPSTTTSLSDTNHLIYLHSRKSQAAKSELSNFYSYFYSNKQLKLITTYLFVESGRGLLSINNFLLPSVLLLSFLLY